MGSEQSRLGIEHNKRRYFLTRLGVVGLALSAVIVSGGCAARAVPPPQEIPMATASDEVPRYGEFAAEPSWRQDFSSMPDGTVDKTVWHPELNPDVPGYNDEVQGYTDNPKNVRIENGALVLEAHKENYQYPGDLMARQFAYTSGRIDTRNSLTFSYGKVEATMRLPAGRGTWPAFWLLSANQPHTGKLNLTDTDWEQERTYMKDGEIDIMEAYGQYPGMIEATTHTFDQSSEGTRLVSDASGVFHTYGVELTPNRIVWTVDGQPYHTFQKPADDPNKWPFTADNRLYVIFNLAMGGSGAGSVEGDGPWRLEVSNVHYIPYVGSR